MRFLLHNSGLSVPSFIGVHMHGSDPMNTQILRRIHRAATKYKEYFVGNTYMFVYENQCKQVIIRTLIFEKEPPVDQVAQSILGFSS